jgi:molecular chaperone IbpA
MNSLIPANYKEWFVGFDKLFDDMWKMPYTNHTVPNWPPCNVRKVAENKYVIEMAVAGFGKNDLEVTLHKNSLTITGRVKSADEGDHYQLRGIASRGFRREFLIEDSVVVQNASYLNGLLRVYLERMVTQDDTRKIEIQEEEPVSDKQVLIEA